MAKIRLPRGRRTVQVVSLVVMPLLLLGSLALFGVGVRQLVRFGRPATYRLVMITDPVPNRQILARRIAAEGRKRRLRVELSGQSYPSLEGLKRVNDQASVNLALVPGGVGGPSQFPDVRQLAVIGTDPLHVMVRAELYGEASRSLAALRGRRINCGPANSVLRILVHDVLRFAGLRPPAAGDAGDFRDAAISSQDLLARLERLSALDPAARAGALADLPDAVVFLSPLPSLLARRLAGTAGYRLVPLPFTEAYAVDRLNLQGTPGAPDAAAVDRASIVAATIPPSLYGTDPPVPPEPCRTLGTHLLLVAHAPTDPEAVVRLLEVVYESPLAGLLRPQPLREQVPQFELHPGVELFLRRRQPLLTPELMSQAGKLMGGLGAFASGVVGLYGFLRILQLRRFESYYQEVRRIVQVARGLDDDAGAPADPQARRAYLIDLLDDLKSEAIRDFAEGGLRGEGLLAGVVALINDTRSGLAASERPPRVAAPRRDGAPVPGIAPVSGSVPTPVAVSPGPPGSGSG
jgi:hypothetical protein